jgi:hypothetical protein
VLARPGVVNMSDAASFEREDIGIGFFLFKHRRKEKAELKTVAAVGPRGVQVLPRAPPAVAPIL